MLTNFFSLFLLLTVIQADVFKKDKTPLESTVEGLVTSTGAQVLQKPRAAYVEGFGIIIALEIAYVAPQGIFDTPRKPAEVRTLVAQRRRDVQEKLTAFVKQRVATTDSIGPSDSLAVVIHILNTNPADITNLPVQIVMAAKKDAPQQVSFREF